MNITVIGTGYVGLVTATVFAHLGNHVIGVDIDVERVQRLSRGESPIFEPGLDDLLRRTLQDGRLSFTVKTAEAVRASEIIFIAVGTPPAADGSTDLSQVEQAARAIAQTACGYRVVVNKSTVPVGTGAVVERLLATYGAPGATFDVLSNPEFLREGTAVHDALHPDRIIIGAASPEIAGPLVQLYRPLNCPLMVTDVPSAEMIKYASNAFLATKISFINTLADLAEAVGADIRTVAKGIGADPRIGSSFLNAGLGYGGSCLPKDVDSLIAVAASHHTSVELLEAVRAVNDARVPRLVQRMERLLGGLQGKTIAVFGLTFKPQTDDLRASRALALCRQLQQAGATVHAHDPIAQATATPLLPGVSCCLTPLHTATEADAVIIATEWSDYAQLDLETLAGVMRGDLLVDGRNFLDPAQVEAAGLRYLGVGRSYSTAGVY